MDATTALRLYFTEGVIMEAKLTCPTCKKAVSIEGIEDHAIFCRSDDVHPVAAICVSCAQQQAEGPDYRHCMTCIVEGNC